MNTTKVQLREPMSFIGVPYRSMGEGLQEQKCLKDSCITKAHPRCDSSLKLGSYRQLSRLVLSTVGLLQATCLVFVFFQALLSSLLHSCGWACLKSSSSLLGFVSSQSALKNLGREGV